MRCISCDAEMRLMQVVPDNTMMVSGYEHRTWQCTGCDEVERRLVFTREKTPVENVPIPPTQPADDSATAPAAAPSAASTAWARAVAKLRGKHTD